MKKWILFSMAACFLTVSGCQTTEKSVTDPNGVPVVDSTTKVDESNIPEQYRRKSARELRKDERRREKTSGIFYNR